MRILANENIPLIAVDALRQEGHDVIWIREIAPGSPDGSVLERAVNEQRVLITFDKDFGELAFRYGLPSTSGIILFRIPTPSAQHIAKIAVSALRQRDDWIGHFSVIEESRIRMTPLIKNIS
jgi:predicted nuclease of predicted toxin-antitoxin system